MTLRERLQAETRPNHDRAEQNLACLMNPEITKAQYIQVLEGMQRFHSWFENSLENLEENFAAKELYLSNRKKLSRVLDDLNYLGVTPAPRTLTTDSDLKEMKNLGSGLWGMIYVIEGSTLGGQVIKRNLQAALGVTEESGASYFSGYGSDTGKMWQHFLRALENPETKANPDVVVQSADLAFQLMDQAFREN